MKIIILHDADARIEVLDVDASLLKDDIDGFLAEEGYSLSNITWLATNANEIPVIFHRYRKDLQNMCQVHTKREESLYYMSIHQQTKALQSREQEELRAAIRQHGKRVENGYEVHFKEDVPVVAGYINYDPRDIAITEVKVDDDGHLTLFGEDNEYRIGDPYKIEPYDIFGGQLEYVTSYVILIDN